MYVSFPPNVGFGNAINYNLYKPLAEGDTETIKIPNAAFDANITSEKVIAKSHIVDLLNSVNSLKITSNSSNFMDMLDINNLTIKSIKNANNNNEISNSLIIRSVLTQVIIDELELEIPS